MLRNLSPRLLLVGLLVSAVSPAHAEVDISGFASIVAGKATQNNEFLADYPKTGIYDENLSFSPDTSVGVQLTADASDTLDFVIQAISNGASDFDVELDWAYLSYYLTPELSIQAGRKRLPLYYYSDFFDVGYAYYWIRPPADNYTWQISNYNGVSLQYQPMLGQWDALFSIYAGREDSEHNDLLSLLTHAQVDETWKNMVGVVSELSHEWIELRATYMRSQLDRTINETLIKENTRQNFYGISINFYLGSLTLLSELNKYDRPDDDIHVTTTMISLGYRLGDFTPHVTHSELKQDENEAGGDEHHETDSIGVRWDINKSTALKLQYDKTRDYGVTIPVLGDGEIIAFGVDLVF